MSGGDDEESDDGERTLPDTDFTLEAPEPTIPIVQTSESALDRAVRLGGLPAPRMRTGSTLPKVIDPDEETAAQVVDPAVTAPGPAVRLPSMEGIVPMDFEATTGQSVKTPNPGRPVPIYLASTAVQRIDLSLDNVPLELTDQRPIVLSEQTDPNGSSAGWEGMAGTDPLLGPHSSEASALAGVLSAVALAEISVVSKPVARVIKSASTVPKSVPPPPYDEGLRDLDHGPPEETAPSLGTDDRTMPLARIPVPPPVDAQAGVATMPLPGVPSPVPRPKSKRARRPVSVVHVTAAVLAVLAAGLLVAIKYAT